jgi:hypothetical protein
MKMTGKFHRGAVEHLFAISPDGRKCQLGGYDPVTNGYVIRFEDRSEHVTEEKVIASGAWRVFGGARQRNKAYNEMCAVAVSAEGK